MGTRASDEEVLDFEEAGRCLDEHDATRTRDVEEEFPDRDGEDL
jgi:hypothetical protein